MRELDSIFAGLIGMLGGTFLAVLFCLVASLSELPMWTAIFPVAMQVAGAIAGYLLRSRIFKS